MGFRGEDGTASPGEKRKTYPCRRADKETPGLLAIVRHANPDNDQEVVKDPQADDGGVDGPLRRGVLPHDGQVRVDGDGRDEQAAGDIADLDQPRLGEAGRGADLDAVAADPDGVEQERGRLVDVGQQEVVDEDQELVRVRLPRGGIPVMLVL